MKKKIIAVCLSIILFVILTPVGSSTQVLLSAAGSSSTHHSFREPEQSIPPLPGYVQNEDALILKVNHPHLTFPFPRQIQKSSFDIVDVLEQIDEPLLRGYIENLTAFGPRVTGTEACVQAAAYIYHEFEAMGLAVQYKNWSRQGYSSSNIEATLEGMDDNTSIFIICAHYDTVAGAPGADDDGSGTAAVLAAASILRNYPLEHTIRFVTFSGEEQGLLGSYCYAEDAAAHGVPIIGVLNADMVSFAVTQDDGQKIDIYEDESSEWLVDFTIGISQMYAPYIGLTVLPQGPTWGSDHYYFWQFGYDAVFYFESHFNEYYHSSEDTIGHMNFTYYVKTSRLIIATLASLTQQSTPVLQIGDITGGFGVKAQIQNRGDLEANNVTWSIHVSGGALHLIDKKASGTFDLLQIGATENITLRPLLGIGRITINVSADALFAPKTYKTSEGFILFFHVFIRS